ncbi:acyl-CoA:6-aminopenicillanic-acid-acyltransferase [Wolfiporia cocos MD-104 SS10]|uniref:Acyl-CoA:6-aminopenicillanic-acid-acyltransferase n=1 Tax=Wolfiporia cocos (strain MD-104) TaxID=742152 RepID=A0A2H3JG23_WOLCO|nr:acyl-CoA:6-aminopenicillanic-acid-acyltransferase [Wolfiporia cocos MD-104 SS10]
MSNDPPKVDLRGTPYEIGFSHGQILAKQIGRQLQIYQNLFQETCKLDWPQVLETAEQFRSAAATLVPDLLEEMQGIADGVGREDVSLVDIIALNARSEIALGKWDDGCTAIAWKVGTTGKQIIAQNWDWRTTVGENLAMVSIEREGKPKIWMVTEPGIVGKIGFNSASVGVCLNAIRARPISTSLLPIHLLLRIALECHTVSDAIATIESLGGAASSQHILIADAWGGRGLELSPCGGVYLPEDEDGIIVHTNHFLANKLVDEPPWLSGSPVRLERARKLCKEIIREEGRDRLGQTVDAPLLRRRIFSDTVNSPQAICCSPDISRGGLARIETLFNIIMVLGEGKEPYAEVVFGRPGAGGESAPLMMPW